MASRRRHSPTAVVIVGAGPAGLVVAHLLHRAGVPFVLLERHPRAEIENRQAKAGSIDYRTVELLTSVGLVPDILQFEVENHRCEFRTPSNSVVFDYGAVTGGKPHFIYPQHLLVGRLCDTLVATGGDIRFGMSVIAVDQTEDAATVTAVDGDGAIHSFGCNIVAGCDGSRSTVAGSLTGCEVVGETPPLRLLAMLGLAGPLEQHTIYAGHPKGFAGQMRRTADITRYYLEVPLTDTVEDWPQDRIREELETRLLVPGRLAGVAFVEPSFVELRMRVTAPMQDRRVFVAGDAAHLITPAGGKGMNLAIADGVEFALGAIERWARESSSDTPDVADRPDRLERYSETRLPVIWRTQAFSRWMLRMMISDQGTDDPSAAFGAGLKSGWVSALQYDPLLASWFAHAYAGADYSGPIVVRSAPW